MQDLTDELPDPDESTSTMLLEDRRHRVPDIWEAVRTGLDGGVWTFPRLREDDAYPARRSAQLIRRVSDSS
jgi:hypothetical protein